MNVDSYPLRFQAEVPSLLDQACVTFVASLLKSGIERCESYHVADIRVNAEREGRLPKSIRELVERYVDIMKKSMLEWVCNYVYILWGEWDYVLNHHVAYLSTTFRCLVWKHDGLIDGYETAKAIVKEVDMIPMEKFSLACAYCMEDEIKRVWVSLDETFRETLLGEDTLMCFWQCYMRGELDTVRRPSAEFLAQRDYIWERDMSWEHLIVLYGSGDHWPVIEFFWNRTNAQDRVQEALFLIRNVGDMCTQFLLPKLTAPELDAVIAEEPVVIMTSMAGYPKKWPFALRTWQYMCGRFGEEEFVVIFQTLITDLRRLCEIIDITRSVDTFLYEVWQWSPEHLKGYLRRYHLMELMVALSTGFLGYHEIIRRNTDRDARLLVELLSGNDLGLNERIWRACFKNWWGYIRPSDMDKMMKLCFANDHDIVRFKRYSLMKRDNLRLFRWIWLENGYEEELREFLAYCSDRTALSELLTEIMYSTHGLCKTTRCYRILKGFFDDVQSEKEFKNYFMRLPQTKEAIKYQMSRNEFGTIRTMVSEFASDDVLKEVKEFILECHYDRMETEGDIFSSLGFVVMRELDRLFKWCDDEELVIL